MTCSSLSKVPCLARFTLLASASQTLDFEAADVLLVENEQLSPKTVYVLEPDILISDLNALVARLHAVDAAVVLFQNTPSYRKFLSVLEKNPLPAVWYGESNGQSATSLALEIQKELSNFLKNKLDNIVSVSHQFALLSLELAEIQSIIYYLKEVIGNPIVVYDEYFQPIAATDDYVMEYREWPGSAEHIFLHNLHFLKKRVTLCSAAAPRRDCARILFPIVLESKRTRASLAVFEINELIEKMDITIFEISVTAVILAIKRRVSLQTVEKKYVSDFVYDLIHSKNSTNEELSRRAKILGIPENVSYLVVDIDVNVDQDSAELNHAEANVDVYDQIVNTIDQHLNQLGYNMLTNRFSTSIVLIHQLLHKDNQALERAKRMIYDIKQLLVDQFPNVAFYIGMGRPGDKLQDVAVSYCEATAAISFGVATHSPEDSFFVSYDDSCLLKIFGKMNDRHMVREIIPESLIFLQEYDKKNNTNFYETLCVYLDYNCNAKKSAEKLYIHYKTMLYRLEKIKREFGIDVASRQNRIQIELGIEMLNMSKYTRHDL